jgi:hypothetical protein
VYDAHTSTDPHDVEPLTMHEQKVVPAPATPCMSASVNARNVSFLNVRRLSVICMVVHLQLGTG